MSAMIGRNTNTYTDTSNTSVALNTTDYVEILASNPNRVGYKIGNSSPHDIEVKEKAFDSPNTTTPPGFPVFKRSLYVSERDTYPIGAVSARSITGTPSITVTEE